MSAVMVVLGASRCHAADLQLTEAMADSEVRRLVFSHTELRGDRRRRDCELELYDRLKAAGIEHWYHGAWHLFLLAWNRPWKNGHGVPACRMYGFAPLRTLREAEREGFPLADECAKRLGLAADGRHPLTRADATGRYRAYRHLLDCEVCQLEGVSRCEVFPRIALREIESDVDPRLDPEAETIAPEAGAIAA